MIKNLKKYDNAVEKFVEYEKADAIFLQFDNQTFILGLNQGE